MLPMTRNASGKAAGCAVTTVPRNRIALSSTHTLIRRIRSLLKSERGSIFLAFGRVQASGSDSAFVSVTREVKHLKGLRPSQTQSFSCGGHDQGRSEDQETRPKASTTDR